MKEIEITKTKNIYDYKPIFEGLVEDFGYIYYHAILTWCEIIERRYDGKFWEVYLIKNNNVVIGICGLYSQYKDNNDELWLGWFGIIPEYRGKGFGKKSLDWMKVRSKEVGAKKIKSYVDVDGKPLPFYYNNGFYRSGNVGEYLDIHTELSIDDFEDIKDHIIEYDL